MTLAEFRNCNEDLKLYAVLSSYLDSYDGVPFASWEVNRRDNTCRDYTTGGVLVEETSPYSTTVEVHAEGWVEL